MDHRTLKEQLILAGGDASLDGEDLLGDDRQHLEINAVELVEAGPSTARREALEELAERDVVKTVGTVEHDTLLRYSL